MKHDDDDNRRVGAAATARSLVVGWCCALVCLSLFSSSLGSVSDGDWCKSIMFVCSVPITRFWLYPARNECVYVMCANAYSRIVVKVGLFCVDRVTIRVRLCEVNKCVRKRMTSRYIYMTIL